MKPSTRRYLMLRSGALKLLSLFFPQGEKAAIDLKKVKNVLVVTDFRLGDAILSIPTLNAIKKTMPQCRLTVFCNQYSADVFAMVASVDAVVKYQNKKAFLDNWKIVHHILSEQFDIAIDLVQDYPMTTALWTFFSGARYRVGYDWYGRGILFNVKVPSSETALHVVDEMLQVCRRIGIVPDKIIPEITVTEEAEHYVGTELKNAGVRDNDLVISIHPGGFYATQRWKPERFAEVAMMAIDKLKARVVVLGTNLDKDSMKNITDKINGPCIALLNYSVPNLSAVLHRSNCLISNNSGALHLAAALGTPTVSTMGPTVAVRWWPKGSNQVVIRKDLPCIGCNSGICRTGTHQCMNDISVEEVFNALEHQLRM